MSVLLLLVFVTLETDVMTLDHRCHQHQICYQPNLRFLHVLLYVIFLLFKAFSRTDSDHVSRTMNFEHYVVKTCHICMT